MHLFLFSRGMSIKMLWFIKNVFREKTMQFLAYSGYFDLIGLRVVWLVCGWFVGGLAGLWVVSSFTANEF